MDLSSEFAPDVFLFFEECGHGSPTAAASLREIRHPSRVNFITAYHCVAVHPKAQSYVGRDFHTTVHFGLLKSSLNAMLHFLMENDHPVVYYPCTVGTVTSSFARVLNGHDAINCPSFRRLDFGRVYSLVNSVKPGSRSNQQKNYGLSTQNYRKYGDDDTINRPTVMNSNLQDGVVPLFVTMSSLISEIDTFKQFHNPSVDEYARAIIDRDRRVTSGNRRDSFLHGLSLLINEYTRLSGRDDSSLDIDSASSLGSNDMDTNSSRDRMTRVFETLGIPLTNVCVFPHVDAGNGRSLGRNFLATASVTIEFCDGIFRRLAFTGYMRKVVEDAVIRSDLTGTIIQRWQTYESSLPSCRKEPVSKAFVNKIWTSVLPSGSGSARPASGLLYRLTHMNKTFYYSLYQSALRSFFERFDPPITKRIEAVAVEIFCNGPDKFFSYFEHCLTLDSYPRELVPSDFAKYCVHSKRLGNSVASNGKATRHQPCFLGPILPIELIFGLRTLLAVINGANEGIINYRTASSMIRKNVRGAGPLKANHLLSLLVLSGLIWKREFLLSCSLSPSLIENTRERVLESRDKKKYTSQKIRTAVYSACDHFGKTQMFGDNIVCEMGKEKTKQAYDCFHPAQSFVYIGDEHPNDGTIVEINVGDGWSGRLKRSKNYDYDKYTKLCRYNMYDSNCPWKWWEAPNEAESFIDWYAKKHRSNDGGHMIIFPNLAKKQKWQPKDEKRLLKSFSKRLNVGANAADLLENCIVESLKRQVKSTIPHGTTKATERRNKKRKRSSMTDEPTKQLIHDTPVVPPGKNLVPTKIVTINLPNLFQDAWKHTLRNFSVDVNASLQYYEGRHLWFAMIESPDNDFVITDTVGSDWMISLFGDQAVPTSSGKIGYQKKRAAMNALQWNFLWTYSTEEWRRLWMDELLDERESVIVGIGARGGGWICTISRISNGVRLSWCDEVLDLRWKNEVSL